MDASVAYLRHSHRLAEFWCPTSGGQCFGQNGGFERCPITVGVKLSDLRRY
jgi:hypothetical protein